MTDITGNEELNSLGYASSAPDFSGLDDSKNVHTQDEVDLPALVRVSKLLENRKAYYLSVEALSLDEKEGQVRDQIIDNKRMVFLISELEALINGTVQKVREKLNER